MRTWKIWGRNLETLYIEADSFDNALAEARKTNANYTSGQIVEV